MAYGRPVAVYADSAFGGVAIYDACDDYVICRDEYSTFGKLKFGRMCKCPIHYDADDRPYFMHYRSRFYLDDFLRTDIF